ISNSALASVLSGSPTTRRPGVIPVEEDAACADKIAEVHDAAVAKISDPAKVSDWVAHLPSKTRGRLTRGGLSRSDRWRRSFIAVIVAQGPQLPTLPHIVDRHRSVRDHRCTRPTARPLHDISWFRRSFPHNRTRRPC